MSSMKRRQFLQFSSALLATLGLSQLDLQHRALRHARVLAQGTPRKIALLVGINEYPEISGFAPLRGCVTDVELQRQLLIHRFGFNPADILTLTDAEATRSNILTAFEEHLVKLAKPTDVVVFHYSGHGSQVTDPDGDFPDGLNSTFVPVDSALPPAFPFEGGVVRDIMGHTLFLLMSALQSEQVTVVLDSCHSGGGTRGNLRVRSPEGIDLVRGNGVELTASPEEFEYQNQWLSRLNLSPEEFIRRRREGIAKGVVIASTQRDQLAADAPFSDFFAGAFTYLMTQYLWQETGSQTFASAIPSIARSTTQQSFSQQEPLYEVSPGSSNDGQPLYFISQQTPPAEAVITSVQGNSAQLWLGGLDPQSLAAFDGDAVLAVVDDAGDEQGLVRLESRDGLIGRGTLLPAALQAAQPGAFLQEQVRGISRDLTLKIGLDSSLAEEMEAARQALTAIDRISPLPLQQEEVQYILGRITAQSHAQWQQRNVANLPPVGSLGLFSPAGELVPGSFGMSGETATDGIVRLSAKFRALLAAYLVKLTLNTHSSKLNVSVSMTPEGQQEQVLAESFTVRGVGSVEGSNPTTAPPVEDARRLPVGTSIQFRLQNGEDRSIYVSLLVIDPTVEISIIFPNQWTAAEDVTEVAAGETLQVPNPGIDPFTLVTQEPKGVTEVLVLASTNPLRQALQALRRLAQQDRGPVALSEPTAVVADLLSDLGGERGVSGMGAAVSGIDTTQLAALSIAFEVI
ncbi:MAG: caspase family protein [Geitlerinemataceae cyanobacterium]